MKAAEKCTSEKIVRKRSSFCNSDGTRARSFETTNILNDEIIALGITERKFSPGL